MEHADPESRKDWSRQAFTDVATTFDQSRGSAFQRFGQSLVELTDLSSGMRVLDVGTGRGAVLIPAAESVGPKGHVVGVDLTEAMVNETGADLRQRGIQNAEVRVMDAEDLQFSDGSFDAVLAGFSLMFFPRLDRALAECRRVLVPGGTLATSTFKTLPPTPAIAQIMMDRRGTTDMVSQLLDTSNALESAMRGAGFETVTVTDKTIELIHPDEDSYWALIMSLLVGTWYRAQPVDIQTRFEADVRARLREIKQPDGIHESVTALFTIAR